jgi:hypothetical protein
MLSGLAMTAAVVAVAAVAVIGIVLMIVLGRRKQDWGGDPLPRPQQRPTDHADHADYGADAQPYPAAPPPPERPGGTLPPEHIPPPPPIEQPGPPRRIDDTERFREQNRPDDSQQS